MYALSHPKIKMEGPIRRVSPDDGFEYFFGYYDKSPWNADEQVMLCLKAANTTKSVAPATPAEIIALDVAAGYAPRKLASTDTWNVQQGCMLQWLGPAQQDLFIHNDFRAGAYRSVVRNASGAEQAVLKLPVYTVSNDGAFALSLDFSRLHRLRPGYGYSNLPDATKGQDVPSGPAIWRLDIAENVATPLVSYADLLALDPRPDWEGAQHKVNHLAISPGGKRFMVLHRWIKGGRTTTRLVTGNCDGTGLYNLADDDFVSHCWWKSDTELLSFLRKKEAGDGYFMLQDRTPSFERYWPELQFDGHPSYCPDGTKAITDTYPDRTRIAKVYLAQGSQVRQLVRVFSPFRYDNEVRCDLHPRWDRLGEKVCIDSACEGRRGLYVIEVA
jgi:hypothetical protein